jgi:elongation factor G
MQNYSADHIRNVVLLSHCGAGKTSLSEAMLFTSGAIPRLGRVDDGSSASDFDPDEIKRRISINLSVLPLEWSGNKINILDAPGYADFVAGAVAGVAVADAAVIVVCAASGIEVGTELMWKLADGRGLPRLIFINKMDRENADFDKVVEQLQKRFGRHCIPLAMPIGAHSGFEGVVDLVGMKAYKKDKKEEAIPASLEAQAKSFREKMVEAVAEMDDELTVKYLDGQEIAAGDLSRVLIQGAKSGKIVPILTGSALQNAGAGGLMDAICRYLPSPQEATAVEATNASTHQPESIKADENAALAALVFMTSADPFVGRVTHFRVYSGSVNSNSQVWNSSKAQMERIGQLFMFKGKAQEAVPKLVAGDIGAVGKLAATVTGDTLSVKEHAVKLAPIVFPDPIYSVALHPKTKTDVDKLGTVLPRLAEEDPTLRVRKDTETSEIVLAGMGEAHVDVVAERMQRKFGVGVNLEIPKVPYRETVTTLVKAEHKHKKQTGGHGQYGHVLIQVEPMPRGTGFEFADKVVGGAVPRNFIPAVEKGVMEARHEGVLARYPIVDVRVTLYDGSAHAVDSSEMSFKIAAAQALKKALSQGFTVLLEPIVHLKVMMPEAFTGDIISDLNTKRARVMGMIQEGGLQVIDAQAPLAEVQRYAVDLRSVTQGRGTYTMQFDHYEEVPAFQAQKIIAARATEKEKEKEKE